MKAHRCEVCGHPLFVGNTRCESCGTRLGYLRAERRIVPVDEDGRWAGPAGLDRFVCQNLDTSGCTWLAPYRGAQCSCCDLTRTRPNDADAVGLAGFWLAEAAKRQLVAELDTLGLPVAARAEDPQRGLAFDLLSSAAEPVVTGHADGVITLDLAESDDARREQRRLELGEPYRTTLGHLRHEVGHYYQWLLLTESADLERARELFGDETADYQAAIDRHYADGPPAHWHERYVSAYATMHPFEDFAETWAHVLHITDALETAREFGLLTGPAPGLTFRDLVTGSWVPLSIALNQMNRSLGHGDLYPFVLAPAVLDKLDFVADLVRRTGDRPES
ncbi:MAG TPA: putative zinc-binding metallopeptidase [Actinotalea sp.]|nr:putative zinc-binding metallopeptidase [Actinotalea sp.]